MDTIEYSEGITMKIYLVRHGEIPSNKEGRVCGVKDEELTAKGKRQAHQCALKLRLLKVKRAYTSPLKRARAVVGEMYDLGQEDLCMVAPDLREQNFGTLEGATYAEFMRWFGNHPEQRAPKGESWEDVRKRVKPLLKIIKEHNEDVAIISHGSTNRIILCELLNIPLDRGRPFYMSPGGITTITIEPDGRPLLTCFNSVSHL
jgi:broad specificity phosphatase PhoE